MRVIEPNHIKPIKKSKSRSTFSWILVTLISLLLAIFIAIFVIDSKTSAPSVRSNLSGTEIAPPQNKKSKKIKTFTSEQFRDLYNNFAYPNTQIISEESDITGNDAADKRIRVLAKDRGYMIRSAPVSDTFVEVEPGRMLQQRAAADWSVLSKSAKKDEIKLTITAAYRSSEDQKAIFLKRLGNVSLQSIAKGMSDNLVNQVLATAAPPGYSRHHSGYTVDIGCGDNAQVRFENSVCYQWLSKDNYKNAKQAGWIPSYPEGAKLQGPEPESWEYVWVGRSSLLE